MLKKLISLLLVLLLVFTLGACGEKETPSDDQSSAPSSDASSEIVDNTTYYLNTLTGENTLSASAKNRKPIAITVNNVRVAQKVQCGLDKADVVFETEVEGGITRLLALFADPTDVKKIGTVRSLRVVFADLAAGMDAILFYHGIDPTYCKPYLKTLNIDSYQIGSSSDSFRDDNGLALEHTLYTTGERLNKVIEKKKFDNKNSGKTWVSFRDGEDKVAPSEQSAKKIDVNFSGTTGTQFIYDENEQKYARARKGVEYTDLASGNRELFTNVLILKTSITDYADGHHRNISLKGGEGYYASAGGVVPIKWTKGDNKDSFKFTLADGSKFTANQGNFYVCIMSEKKTVTFE